MPFNVEAEKIATNGFGVLVGVSVGRGVCVNNGIGDGRTRVAVAVRVRVGDGVRVGVEVAVTVAVGVFVVYIGGGFEAIFARAGEMGLVLDTSMSFDSRWITTLVLSIAAIVCLPRQFQVTVVENSDENHLRVAGWAFPAYMMLMSIFILPIAVYGLTVMPADANPDMFALTLPLAAGQNGLALFAFIGGFSSATSMIILESIALSIMVSNHIIMPLVLRFSTAELSVDGQGVSRLLLVARRYSNVLYLPHLLRCS